MLPTGTIVWTDMWAVYNHVQHIPHVAQHQTVNHSIEFVNSATQVHTEHIESYRNIVKTKIKRMKGWYDQMISSFLNEFVTWASGRTASTALRSLCRDIALYPVWLPPSPKILKLVPAPFKCIFLAIIAYFNNLSRSVGSDLACCLNDYIKLWLIFELLGSHPVIAWLHLHHSDSISDVCTFGCPREQWISMFALYKLWTNYKLTRSDEYDHFLNKNECCNKISL